jgi:hypothetical protein
LGRKDDLYLAVAINVSCCLVVVFGELTRNQVLLPKVAGIRGAFEPVQFVVGRSVQRVSNYDIKTAVPIHVDHHAPGLEVSRGDHVPLPSGVLVPDQVARTMLAANNDVVQPIASQVTDQTDVIACARRTGIDDPMFKF